jgi:hypothetical protein
MQQKIEELQIKVREVTIQLVTDLEISAGMTQLKDRTVRIRSLNDPAKFPQESLEAMQRILEAMQGKLLEQDYIQ